MARTVFILETRYEPDMDLLRQGISELASLAGDDYIHAVSIAETAGEKSYGASMVVTDEGSYQTRLRDIRDPGEI